MAGSYADKEQHKVGCNIPLSYYVYTKFNMPIFFPKMALKFNLPFTHASFYMAIPHKLKCQKSKHFTFLIVKEYPGENYTLNINIKWQTLEYINKQHE